MNALARTADNRRFSGYFIAAFVTYGTAEAKGAALVLPGCTSAASSRNRPACDPGAHAGYRRVIEDPTFSRMIAATLSKVSCNSWISVCWVIWRPVTKESCGHQDCGRYSDQKEAHDH
jgi:hypothetical protein